MAPPALARTRGRTPHVNALRCAAAAALAIAACAPLRAADMPKQLAWVAGTVQYQTAGTNTYERVFGRIQLPDTATAVTLAQSRAQVVLPDSSTIDIGAATRVRIGAFNAVESGKANVVALELGALHFVVRHPPGGRANYRFVTPTSQIAVRGTDGYIVTGPSGTDFYCVDCAPGDVTVTVGRRDFPLKTGDQAIVIGATADTASVDVVARPCGNPAAIALSDGKLGAAIPPAERVDTTGSLGGDPLQPVPLPSGI